LPKMRALQMLGSILVIAIFGCSFVDSRGERLPRFRTVSR
jgi:hypothetical protein